MKKMLYVIGISIMGIVILFTGLFFYSESAKCEAEIRAASETEKNAAEIIVEAAKGNSPVRTNEADLVRIRAALTKKVKDEPETMEEVVISELEQPNAGSTKESIGEANAGETVAKVVEKDSACLNVYELEMLSQLRNAGIEWWFPYGRAQMFQESRMDPNAVNKTNGKDKGILQYRETYWLQVAAEHGFPDADIFDWRVQIRIYAMDTARRLSSGLSIEETISRHKQSDYGPFDAAYVEHVMRWVE